MILPPSTAPPSDCTPFDEYPKWRASRPMSKVYVLFKYVCNYYQLPIINYYNIIISFNNNHDNNDNGELLYYEAASQPASQPGSPSEPLPVVI